MIAYPVADDYDASIADLKPALRSTPAADGLSNLMANNEAFALLSRTETLGRLCCFCQHAGGLRSGLSGCSLTATFVDAEGKERDRSYDAKAIDHIHEDALHQPHKLP